MQNETQIKSTLAELNNILKMLQQNGTRLTKTEHLEAGQILQEELTEEGVKTNPTFWRKVLNTAKDVFPLVLPIIKTLLI